MSLTRVEEFIERVRERGKPCRIIYLSDFDPAGRNMPVAVARKIEFLVRNMEDVDIQLETICLTHQQCVDFRLPRTPIKSTEKRAAEFENRFGEGATELDALEALHPGVLGRMVTDCIRKFYDSSLQRQIDETRSDLADDADEVKQRVYDAHKDEIKALTKERDTLATRVESILRRLRKAIKAEEADLIKGHEKLSETIEAELEHDKPDPEDYDWPCPDDDIDFDDPLFDSRRFYLDQNRHYSIHKNGQQGELCHE